LFCGLICRRGIVVGIGVVGAVGRRLVLIGCRRRVGLCLREEAGGCADCAGEGAVVALLSDLDDGTGRIVPAVAGHRWHSGSGPTCRCGVLPIISRCRLAFCEVAADPAEEGVREPGPPVSLHCAGLCGRGQVAGTFQLGRNCALSFGDCSKAPVPIKNGDGRRNQQGLLHDILSSMFGLAARDHNPTPVSLCRFQVDESGGAMSDRPGTTDGRLSAFRICEKLMLGNKWQWPNFSVTGSIRSNEEITMRKLAIALLAGAGALFTGSANAADVYPATSMRTRNLSSKFA